MSILVALVFWLACWALNAVLARSRFAAHVSVRIAIPVLFGLAVLAIWQGVVTGLSVPEVILPAPRSIGAAIGANLPMLWADFVQTILKGALSGYVLGAGSAFAVAVLVDRVPFLRAGLLPIGNFVAALPIVGIAPIMVMWFGFDWHSKAAVVGGPICKRTHAA